MNQRSKRFSLTNLSYVEEMKSKLQKLDLVRNQTNALIAQSDLFRKMNTKQKSINSILKRRTLQSLLRTPQILNSPTNDEHSAFSISTISPSVDSEYMPIKDKFHHDFYDESQTSEFSYRKYRTTHSITSSSSTSKDSRDEPFLPQDILRIDKLYIFNEIYPSIEYKNMNGTPLAFLGSEKLLRTRIDWTKVEYPLSSYYIEIIIDLIIVRPSFIREIPKVTKFNLYRPLVKIISGHLFFDHGEHKAGIHRCDRKYINRKFTIQDLASIHRREFHIINYNVIREQRFIDLYENLFQIHLYQIKSTHWKTY